MIWVVATAAFAWDTTGRVWDQDEVPFVITDHDLAGVADEVGAAQAALDAWSDSGCDSGVRLTLGGVIPAAEAVGSQADDVNQILLDDPADDIVEPGVVAVTFTRAVGTTDDGYTIAYDTDIVLNDGVVWTDDPAGACVDGYDLQGVLTRQLGFALGLDPGGAPGSVMATEPTPCDDGLRTLQPDDLHGLSFLYGALGSPRCYVGEPGVLTGGLPLQVVCDVVDIARGDAEAVQATWDFAGAPAEGETAEHTFDTEGAYLVEGCASVADACAPLCNTFEVLACAAPEAALEVEVDGGLVTLLNDTPVPLAGCLTDVQWEIFDADDALFETSDDWEPTLTLPGGAYTVRLSVRGPGGEGTAEGEVRVGSGCGCASSSAPSWVDVLALLARRPRSLGDALGPRVVRALDDAHLYLEDADVDHAEVLGGTL